MKKRTVALHIISFQNIHFEMPFLNNLITLRKTGGFSWIFESLCKGPNSVIYNLFNLIMEIK